ncbi:MAG: alpha/beta hydrolase [Actinomycetota bacterium]
MAFVTAAGGNRVAYDVTGDGEVDLLLVHGITENRRFWDPLLDDFAARYRVIRVDLPGHGESDPADDYSLARLAADVGAVLDEVGRGEPYAVGHSLGGYVVSILAAQRPTRAVVNVDQVLALAAFKEQLAAVEEMLRGEAFAAVMGGLFDQLMGPLGEEERARITPMRTPKQDVVLSIWDPIFTLTVEEIDALVRELLGGIAAPYLSLHGTEAGPDYVAWLRSVIPQAEYEVWADHGHYPHLMDPERFVERIAAFA